MPRSVISDYAFLSDSFGSALVSRGAAVEWLCLPRFDSPPLLAGLLGPGHGHFSVTPIESAATSRRYLNGSLVLETEFRGVGGRARLLDALVAAPSDDAELGSDPPHHLIRALQGLEGSLDFQVELAPRQTAETNGVALHAAGFRNPGQVGPLMRERLTLRAGETRTFSLGLEPPPEDGRPHLEQTIEVWRRWAERHLSYRGPYSDSVHTSLTVLQGLTFQPCRSLLAAATTSIPGGPDGHGNWDYRFSWLRDAAFLMRALTATSCAVDTSAYMAWIANTAGLDLKIVYRVDGKSGLTESEDSSLPGFGGEGPVRIGNAAEDQTQLDVYGELAEAAAQLAHQAPDTVARFGPFIARLADEAAAKWRLPDAGLWEARDAERHYLPSKLMCWVALDRAIQLAEKHELVGDSAKWRAARDELRATIETEGWNELAGAFTGAFGSRELDGSVLLLPLMGFLPVEDERVRRTLAAIEEKLQVERLIGRWQDERLGFWLTTFWFVECLVLAGRHAEAKEWFDSALGRANDLGLLSEGFDPAERRAVGNFPQALSHAGLINAAVRLALALHKEESNVEIA